MAREKKSEGRCGERTAGKKLRKRWFEGKWRERKRKEPQEHFSHPRKVEAIVLRLFRVCTSPISAGVISSRAQA